MAPTALREKKIAQERAAYEAMTKRKPFSVTFTVAGGDLDAKGGTFTVNVYPEWAPRGADRFHHLVKHGYYDANRFFRVIPGFMAQWGISSDPAENAKWKDKKFPDDPVKHSNKRGTITFATSGGDSRTTQLFINYGDNSRLDEQVLLRGCSVVPNRKGCDLQRVLTLVACLCLPSGILAVRGGDERDGCSRPDLCRLQGAAEPGNDPARGPRIPGKALPQALLHRVGEAC